MGLFFAAYSVLPASVVARQREAYEKAISSYKARLARKPIPVPSEEPTGSAPAQFRSPAEVPSPARPLPLTAEVAMVQPVQISVVIGGKDAGVVTLQRGMRLKLISVEGDQLKIQYMDTVTTIPRTSTDLPASAK